MSEDDIQRTLGKIEATLEAIAKSVARIERTTESLSTRVTTLERWRSYTTGAIAVLVAAVGAAYKYLLND